MSDRLDEQLGIADQEPPGEPSLRYGLALLLIGLSIFATAFADQGRWQAVLSLALQGAALIFVLRVSEAHRTVRLFAFTVTVVGVVAASIAVWVGGSDGPTRWSNLISAMMAFVAPVAIVRRLARERVITLQVVAGAVAIYLLIGQFFAVTYRTIGSQGSDPFFAQLQPGEVASSVDYTYFSYVTLATVGYGDLTARGDGGRMLAISEALMGQIYLVTVVAVAVSRLGMARGERRVVTRRRRQEPPGSDEPRP